MQRVAYSKLRSNVLALPLLPTPQLSNTFERYTSSVRPLKRGVAVDGHFERMSRFASGSAKVAQAVLESAPTSQSSTGKIETPTWGMWRDDEVLRQRSPLPIHSNCAVGFKKFGAVDASAFDSHVVLKKVGQAELAAHILHSVSKFMRVATVDGVAVAEGCDASNLPDQFCSARLAVQNRDEIFHGDWTVDAQEAVVLRDGHIYFVRLVCEKTGHIVDAASLQKALEHILITTPLADNAAPVSALTSLPRDEAASAFQVLRKESPQNLAALEAINRAAVVLCLDTEAWPTPEIKQRYMLFGGGAESESRWYNKNQIIVSADAEVAVNYERALSDNHASDIWCSAVYNDVQGTLLSGSEFAERFSRLPEVETIALDTRALVRPVTMNFGKGFAASIRAAKDSARQLADSVSVDYVRIPTGALNMHADAFMQTCFQLAYFMEHRRLAPTRQEISMSSFYKGGMACIRTAMPIVQPFLDKYAAYEKSPESVSTASLYDALMDINSHYIAKLAEVGKGKGVGEHLHALEFIACVKEARNPKFADAREFFGDPLFKAWDTPLLSTGSIDSPYADCYSLGPQMADGFGLGYVIQSSCVIVSISSFHEDKIAPFRDTIGKAARILRDLLANNSPQ